MDLTTLALLILTPLLVWRIYSRLKTMMARQPSVLTKHWTGLGTFLAVIVVVATEVFGKPEMMGWWAVGTAAGIGYGIWGLRLMRYESNEEGFFFKPNARLGIMIALLFAARVLYIGFEVFVNQGSNTPMQRFTDNPITVLTLTLMAGYFGTLSAGLLRWRLR